MSTPRLHPDAVRFMAYLRQFQTDRGALSNLRGALSDARRQRAWPLLGGFPSAIGNPAFETAAALWAGDPELAASTGCLGDMCRGLAGRYDAKTAKFEHDSFQSRFQRLLTCDHDEIAARVVPVVRAAQAKGIAVNYTRLLSDLLWWNDRTKVEWAKAFWEAPAEDAGIAPELLDQAPVAAAAVTEVQP